MSGMKNNTKVIIKNERNKAGEQGTRMYPKIERQVCQPASSDLTTH